MSTYVGLYCEDCHDGDDLDFNHGEKIMAMLLKVAPKIIEIRELDDTGYLEMGLMGHPSTSLEFAIVHIGHNVVIRNEYGNTYDESLNEVRPGVQAS